jgi:hypothetical protein
MSISSTGSSMTIKSFRGEEEVDLDTALDELYTDLQRNLNNTQSAIRQLAACPEQDADFIEAAKIYFQLDDYVDTLLDLFRELKSVSKEVLGKCPAECKEEYQKMITDRKQKKIKEKEVIALAKHVEKIKMSMPMSDIKE